MPSKSYEIRMINVKQEECMGIMYWYGGECCSVCG